MNTLYKDAGMFRDALALTREETGFAERLIEKDFFCTAVLEYLATNNSGLVFKGGTCLAKIHADFYRLSEDLDFVIPTPSDASRSQRRKKVATLKAMAEVLPERLPIFRVVEPLTGANISTQYIMTIGYTSLTDRRAETIKIEVGLREPLLLAVEDGSDGSASEAGGTTAAASCTASRFPGVRSGPCVSNRFRNGRQRRRIPMITRIRATVVALLQKKKRVAHHLPSGIPL